MQVKKSISKQPMPENAKRVFKGIVFDVYQWEQKGYDGKIKTFEKLKRYDTAVIIPITEDGKIIIANQEQPGKKPFVGLVGGRLDEGEEPLEAAKRELLEETGYRATEWELFDAVQPVSKIDWTVHTFIAKGCHKVAEQSLDGAEKIDLLFVDFDKFIEIVLQGELADMELKIKLLQAKLDSSKMQEMKKQFGL
jgi:8-oxo-dGTP pyrophosphatase MutT (NUDIX family)